MTRPRSQQINDPSTRYTSIPLNSAPTPGTLSTSISGILYTNFVNSTITKLVDGVETPTSAVLTSNVLDPYVLVVGSYFDISVDGSNPVRVTLEASDFVVLNAIQITTGHRVSAKINSTLSSVNPAWSNVASRTPGGFLRLSSPSTGLNSTVSITGLPVVLGVLGFGSVPSAIAVGKDLARGVVTSSLDDNGGLLFLNWSDGRKVLAQSNETYSYTNSPFFSQNIPTGQPVYARITKTNTPSLDLNYVAKCEGSLPIVSKFSNFGTITAGENISFNVINSNDGITSTFSATFSSTPTSVSSVVNTINSAANQNSFGKAFNSLPEPYFTAGILQFKLNGNSTISVNITNLETTASLIVSSINAAITLAGQSVQGQAYIYNTNQFKIQSLISGPNSSVEILNSSSSTLLRELGLVTGKFSGWILCRAIGAEIEISSPNPCDVLIVDLSSSALTKLGLGHYVGSGNPVVTKEVPCKFPTYPDVSFSLSTQSLLNLQVPELMEAGEVPDIDAVIGKIAEYSPVSEFTSNLFTTNIQRSLGSVEYGVDGKLSADILPYAFRSGYIGSYHFPYLFTNQYPASIWQVTPTRYNPSFSTYNQSDDPVRIYPYTENNVDNGVTGYKITLNALKDAVVTDDYTADSLSKPSSIYEFTPTFFAISYRDSGSSVNFNPANDLVFEKVSLPIINRRFSIRNTPVIETPNAPLRFNDINIGSSTTNQYVELSSNNSSNGDQAIRIHDNINEQSTILSSLNSRLEIVVGNGTTTFGDFNGTNALDQVVTYLSSKSDSRSVYIKLKSGVYTCASTLSIINKDWEMEGFGSVIITAPSSPNNNTLEFSGSPYRLKLRNLEIRSTTNYRSVRVIGSGVLADSCKLYDVSIETSSDSYEGCLARFTNCYIYGRSQAISLIAGTTSATAPIIFEGCTIDNSSISNVRCCVVTGAQSTFTSISFNDCVFKLSYYGLSSGGSYTLNYSTVNTGLVELAPLNDGRSAPGLIVKNLSYSRCTVNALSGNRNLVLQVLSAEANKLATSYALGNPWGTIENLNFYGCSFNSKLGSPNLAYFMVGHGVINLNIDNCSFNPTVTGTGIYGLLPEWMLHTNPSQPDLNIISTGIVIASKNSYINNSKISNVFLNVSSASIYRTSDLYLVNGNNSFVNGLYLNAVSPSIMVGSGSAQRDYFIHVSREWDSLNGSEIYSSTPSVSLRDITLKGTPATTTEWFTHSAVHIEDCYDVLVDKTYLKGFTTGAPVNNITGIYLTGTNTVSRNLTVENSSIYDVSFGVQARGNIDSVNINRNYLSVGNYRGVGQNSSGIYVNNDGIDSKSVIINDNNVEDSISNDSTYASIHCVVGAETSAVLPLNPIITSNTVNCGDHTKDGYYIAPAIPSVASDRLPRAVFRNNSGNTNTSFLSRTWTKARIRRWNSGTSTYQTINGSNTIPPGTLVGAQSFNGSSVAFTKSGGISAGSFVRLVDPISIDNLHPGEAVNIICNVNYDVTISSIEIIRFRLVYYNNNTSSWIPFGGVWEFTEADLGSINRTATLHGVAPSQSSFTGLNFPLEIDIECTSLNGITANVTYSVISKKLTYSVGTDFPMQENMCVLV
jgi:hypothetical protein